MRTDHLTPSKLSSSPPTSPSSSASMSSLGRNALLEVPLYCAGMILPIINGSNQDVTTKAHYLCPNCSKIQQVIEFVSRSSDDATLEIVHQYESDWRTIDVPHHQTGHDLAQSLRNGCHLCSLLMDQLLENDDTSGDQFFELFLDQRVKNALAEEMKVELRIPTDPSVSWDNARLVINLTSEPELRSKTIGLGPSTNEIGLHAVHEQTLYTLSTASSPSLAWARNMLGTCVNSHIECSTISNRPGYLPTRIIDVGRPGDSFQPRLVISAEENISEPYAALSYSWGGSWPCSLTTAKLDEYRKSIPVHVLPKTLYDAMIVARRLGISYLWIDALTIIQDDRVDWEKESKTMADVYRNALLTLAGLSSTSSDHGLFRLRNPLVYQPCWLADSTDGTSIFALPGYNNFDESHVQEMPLLSRGWTFQERLLGSRILYFGEALVWECCEDMVVEVLHCRSEDDWEYRKDWPALASKRLHQEIQALEASADVARETLRIWHDLVMRYSQTKLTVASDRLIAITGLARLVESHTNLRFVAGIWTPFSVEQLMWSIQDSIPSVTNLAPTWSWLNTSKAIYFHTIDLREEYYRAEIVDVDIFPKGSNSSFEHLPLSGRLYIKGMLLGFKKFNPNNDDQHAEDLEIESLPSLDIGWFYWDQDVHNDHQSLTMRGNEASRFHFLTLSWGLQLNGRRWWFKGLVLVRSTAVPNAYERRGLIEVSTQIEGDLVPSLYTKDLVLV